MINEEKVLSDFLNTIKIVGTEYYHNDYSDDPRCGSLEVIFELKGKRYQRFVQNKSSYFDWTNGVEFNGEDQEYNKNRFYRALPDKVYDMYGDRDIDMIDDDIIDHFDLKTLFDLEVEKFKKRC